MSAPNLEINVILPASLSGLRILHKLINSSGLSGYKIGGAMVSPIHNNFFINTGEASARDFEKLGEFVIHEVEKHHGIRLEWEIHLIGESINEI